ncbi:helix-turn-helix transcriptional regulator [Lactobacillus melliventris]|uniref:helix-turn-helix transcriptional regulator n=1 Tax=Lactobacillus melliventris TaxID=1218507 RepID=UPI0021ABDB34|nr:helix-turn-helix transcriptional regulator [Lactobacillus melliventris]
MKLTLKSLRANKNMTQVEAAKAIGVGKETWRNYENGKTYPDVLTPLRELRKCLM